MKRYYKYIIYSILTLSAFTLSAQTSKESNTIYPSYNTSPIAPDKTGMESNAVELAAKMKIGWNIGNTLEATGGETAWGNPKVTKELIDAVKKGGFNAIRIPCAWNQYLSNASKAEIDETWMKRVQTVVDYCIENDMYVLLNIHWDGGWLETNCNPESQEKVNAKQKAFWEQIATHFRDYDEHLIFGSANEPSVNNSVQMNVLNTYHQTCIDAVRATGGRNSYRIIVVQGPTTDFEKTNKLMHTLPNDVVKDRLMVEVHYYTPFTFCGLEQDADWGKMNYYWGKEYNSPTDTIHNANWGLEKDADMLFGLMKKQFVDKGIPVIMGEYGVIRRGNLTGDDLARHLASREHWLRYITKTAIKNGCIPFYWDAGGTGIVSWGLFSRTNYKVTDYQGLNAIMQGAQK